MTFTNNMLLLGACCTCNALLEYTSMDSFDCAILVQYIYMVVIGLLVTCAEVVVEIPTSG